MSTRKPLRRRGTAASTTVRRTVDLPLEDHRRFDQRRHDAAGDLGLTRVTGQEVLAALIHTLLIDERLSRKVARTIAAGRRPTQP